jgi:hypothetical protein
LRNNSSGRHDGDCEHVLIEMGVDGDDDVIQFVIAAGSASERLRE